VCAICGLVRPGAGGERARVERANDRMVHRGPDDGGTWQGDGVCLGARRLAILDLSVAGHQPMASDDGRYVIVFNGEIYNFARLRAALDAEATFRGRSDTEVLLHGVRQWGFDETVRRSSTPSRAAASPSRPPSTRCSNCSPSDRGSTRAPSMRS
jgi:asparagine synthase (glutamine-hydrolysing)